MDPQELEQLTQQLKQLNENFAELGVSVNKADQNLSDVLGKRFPGAAKPTIAALQGLGNAATDVATALYRGERGAKVMAQGFDKLADGLQAAVAIFTLFTPQGKALSLASKLLINGVAMAGKAMSTFNKLSAEQSDKLFETYQDLSKIGAAGVGVEQMFENLQRMGLTSAEISQYTAVLKKNAKELSAFGASTADGARNLSAISGAITKGRLGEQLMMMGYSAEDIAASTASYMQLQTRLGRLQLKTTTEIANESGRYAIELDKMARLTGMAREEQEAERASHVEDERYVGFLAGEAQREGYDVQAFEQSIAGLPEEMQRAMKHLVAGRGALTSAESKKLTQMDPEAYQRSLAVLEGRMTPIEARQQTLGKGLEFTKTFADQIAIGATQGGEGFGLSTAGKRGIYMQGQSAEATKSAAEKLGMGVDEYLEYEQKRAVEGDKTTAGQVKLRREQMSAAQSLDTFVNLGVKPATSAMTTFATAVERTARGLPGAPAGGRPTTGAAGGNAGGAGGGSGAPGGGTLGIQRGDRKGYGAPTSAGDISKVLESGQGYTVIETASGERQRREGTRAWRNNNPGNLEYGKFAKSMGAIASDGRFAIFPNKETGDRAREGLLFGSNYGNLSIAQAISKYAPPNENDTQKYLESVLNATMASADTPMSALNPSQRQSLLAAMERMEGYKTGSVMKAATGGVFAGPPSGFPTILHGVEAVVPLPDGKTIPVSIDMEQMVSRLESAFKQNGFNNNNETSALMAQQIGRLDEMINQMRSQVNISQKILQYAR
jgi:hypothetical protein